MKDDWNATKTKMHKNEKSKNQKDRLENENDKPHNKMNIDG